MKRIDFYRQRRITQRSYWDALQVVLEEQFGLHTKSRQEALEAATSLLRDVSSPNKQGLSSIPGLVKLLEFVLEQQKIGESLNLEIQEEERVLEELQVSLQPYQNPPVSEPLPWAAGAGPEYGDGPLYSGIHMYHHPNSHTRYFEEPVKPAASFATENTPRLFFLFLFGLQMLWNYAWRGTNAGVPTAAVFGSGRSLTSTNAFSASTTFPTNVLATLWAFGVFHMIAVFGAGFLCYVFLLWSSNPWPKVSKRQWRRALDELGKAKTCSQLHQDKLEGHLLACLAFLGRPLPTSTFVLLFLIVGTLVRLMVIGIGVGSWLEKKFIPTELSRQAGTLAIEVYQLAFRKYLWMDSPLLTFYMFIQALVMSLAAIPDVLANVYSQAVLASFCTTGIPPQIASLAKHLMFKWTIPFKTYRHYKYFYMIQAVTKIHRCDFDGVHELLSKTRRLLKLENDQIKSVLKRVKACPDPAVNMSTNSDYLAGDLIVNISDAAATYILEVLLAMNRNDLSAAMSFLDLAKPLLSASGDHYCLVSWSVLRALLLITKQESDPAFLKWEKAHWEVTRNHHQLLNYPATLSRLGAIAFYHSEVLHDYKHAVDLAIQAVEAFQNVQVDMFVPVMCPLAIPLAIDVLIDELARARSLPGHTAEQLVGIRVLTAMIHECVGKLEVLHKNFPLLVVSCLRLRAWCLNDDGNQPAAAERLKAAWEKAKLSQFPCFERARVEQTTNHVFGHLNGWLPWEDEDAPIV